jgi:hypothetical protein
LPEFLAHRDEVFFEHSSRDMIGQIIEEMWKITKEN